MEQVVAQKNLVLWTRHGKYYAVVGHHSHQEGVEHHVSEKEFDELKQMGAKVEHAPHQVNG